MRFSDKSINFRTLLQKYQKEGSCTFVTVAAQSFIHRRTDLQILTASAAVVQQYRSAFSPSSRD